MPANRLLKITAILLVALALAAFIGYFLVYTYYAVQLFQFPFDYDQGEGFELMDTILFSQGQWPYRDIDTYPFYSSNYPPLFHLVTVPLVWLFGPHYWTGRAVAYVGTLITAAAISFAVYRRLDARGPRRDRWWLAALAGLAFLASNYIYHVGPLFRQHLFMVMFETLAVVVAAVVVSREEKRSQPSWPGWLLIMLLLLAAGYTKQLAYATVAAVFIFLFLRQPRRAVLWAVPFAAVTGLIYLFIDWQTGGQWSLNTVTANLNPFIPGQAEALYRQWFSLHLVLNVAALLFAAYQLYRERLSVYTVWFVIAIANGITAGKWGAGESYFATAIAAGCILAGLAFGRVLDAAEQRGLNWRSTAIGVIAALFLVQAYLVFHLPTHTPALRTIATVLGQPTEVYIAPQTSCSAPRPVEPIPYVDSAGVGLLGRPPTRADTLAGQRIAAFILEGETAAFSEEAGFNLYAGRDVVTNPTQLLNLYNNGAADISAMVDMLNNQAFDAVILRAQFYPPPVLDAIGQQYETVELVQMNGFVYCLMRPR